MRKWYGILHEKKKIMCDGHADFAERDPKHVVSLESKDNHPRIEYYLQNKHVHLIQVYFK